MVPKVWDGPRADLFQEDGKRVIFVNPYEGDLCLTGTTDVPDEEDPADVSIDRRETGDLLRVVNRYAATPPTQADIVHCTKHGLHITAAERQAFERAMEAA